MGWRRREESYVRDGGMDGGMPVLIRVWEQRLSVRCPPVNGPVSLRYHRDRAGTHSEVVGEKELQQTWQQECVYEYDGAAAAAAASKQKGETLKAEKKRLR